LIEIETAVDIEGIILYSEFVVNLCIFLY